MELIIAIVGSGALSAVISGVFALINNRMKKNDAMSKGLRMALYFEFRTSALQKIAEGQITPDDLEAMIEGYNAYKALGGDGFCDELMRKCQQLPMRK